MLSLSYQQVNRIKYILQSADLSDLVAVFSQQAKDGLLFVYNTQGALPSLPDNCKAISVDDLNEVDLETYDGLLVGISALDVIRDDLVTKGPGFYPIERVFLEFGQRPSLHFTLRNLARHLLTLLEHLPNSDSSRRQRTVAKVLRLALPALLDQWGAQELVAVLPGSDLARFIAGKGGRWITIPGIATLKTVDGDAWILALEELKHCVPCIDHESPYFFELRGLLRHAGYAESLRRTCRSLARYYAEKAAQRPELWEPAWELMAESWLAAEDVEDLIAFFPHTDFEHFARTGEGLRVYRTLDAESAGMPREHRISWDDSHLAEATFSLRDHGFSLIPLPFFEEAQLGDLGWLLWKAGHEISLSRTLWLLARDGLESPPPRMELAPDVLTDLAQRAMILVSLSAPWSWRQGRYAQLVSSVYHILREALSRQAEANRGIMSHYYQALADWYDCYKATGEDVEAVLRQIAHRLRALQRATRAGLAPLAEHLDYARQLIEVEETTLFPLANVKLEEEPLVQFGAQVLPGEPDRIRGMAARRTSEKACLSPIFRRIWGQLLLLRQQRLQTQLFERNADVLQRDMARLLTLAKRQRRLTFAPPHEMAVLHFAYDREIAELEKSLRELRTEARLQIVPLNPHVEFLREIDLMFEVRNIGHVQARSVEIMLAPNASFELMDRSSVREFPSLSPGVSSRFSYRVRALQLPECAFNFRCTYADLDTPQEILVRLPVRSVDEIPFTLKGDPYNFGRAIQDPADFYGREEEMQKLLASLARGGHTNFMLRGPRRMGKTSMLHMLEHALENPEVRRRYDVPESWDPFLDCYIPVMLDLQAFRFQDDATHVRLFFYSLLDEICARLLPDQRVELLRGFDERRREIDAPRAVLEQLRKAFRQRPEARVLVLLDEYDEIYRPYGRTLDTALRHVVQEEQRLTWVIASTLFMFREGKSYGSPWFNILDTIELECLSQEAARRLVEEPSRKEGVTWQSDAIVALLDETGRHPAFLQLFCSRVIAYLNERRQNYVLPETIIALADQIVEERGTIHNHLEFYWADTPGVGRLVLLAAEESDSPPTRLALQRRVYSWLKEHFGSRAEKRVFNAAGNPIPWWEREFEDSMAWVSQVVNALSFDRVSRSYLFTVPLFRRWLQRKRHHENLLTVALNTVAAEMERGDDA